MKLLSKQEDNIYAILRGITGALFAFHGVQKIFGFYATHETAFGSQMWFGGIIELIGGLFILLGFQTRIAAFISSGTMAVAYVQFHWKLQFNENFFPAINHGDTALLYCFVFMFIASKGAGKWGLDKK